MISNKKRFSVRITHIPTGIAVESDSGFFRTERQCKDALIKLLKSRLHAQKKTQPIANFSYELPDDNPFPYDLSEFKRVEG